MQNQITVKIHEILEQRQALLPRIAVSLRRADSLLQSIQALESHLDSFPDPHRAESEKLILKLRGDCRATSQQLQLLQQRFSRPYLTLLCFGKARQGKSRLIQCLTGLSDREVPTGALGHCTATKLEIRHTQESPHATVTTFDESNFIAERLAPFYRDFGLFEEAPTTLDEFLLETLPEPSLAAKFIGATHAQSVTKLGQFEELRKLQSVLPRFRKFLRGRVERVDLTELHRWISYPKYPGDEPPPDADFRCHAVRRAQAFVHMPLPECHAIRIFDTPGVNNHTSGDYDSLARLIDEEADAALVTRLTSHLGDAWVADDSLVLDEIGRRLTGGTITKRLLSIVLNEVRTQASNRITCEHVREGAVKNGLQECQVAISDCTDLDSLHDAVIVPLLSRLVEECPALDERRIAGLDASLIEVERKLHVSLENLAQAARVAAAQIDPDHLLCRWISNGQELLAAELRMLKVKAGDSRREPDKDFLNDVKRAAQTATDAIAIPEAQAIYDFCLRNRYAQEAGALEYFLKLLRCDIAAVFGELRDELGRNVIERWSTECWTIIKQIGISDLIEPDASKPAFRQLGELADRAGKLPQLTASFQMLAEFKIHYPHFLSTVWKVLEYYEPNRHVHRLGKPTVNENEAEQGCPATVSMPMCERAAKLLADLKTKAIKDIAKELQSVATLPSELSWSLLCDVFDRMVIARGIDAEWERFLRTYRDRLKVDGAREQATKRERLLTAERFARDLRNGGSSLGADTAG